MSVNIYNKTNNELKLIAGGLLYADAPVGSIIPYGGTTAPSGWLLCQGQAVSRTEYADLFKAIGTAYGSGDDSTTFNIPDLRETVPVGSGTRGNGVAKHDTYDVGEFKDDQIQNIGKMKAGATTGWSSQAGGMAGYITANSDLRTGDTTHGKQLGVNYIIKATIIALPSDFEVAVDTKLNNYVKTSVLTSWTDVTSEAASFTGSIRTNTIQIFSNGYECKIIGELLLDVAQPINQGWIESLFNISINNGYRPKTTTSLSGFFAANYHSPIIWQVAPSGRISGLTGSNLTEISRIPINGTWSLYN